MADDLGTLLGYDAGPQAQAKPIPAAAPDFGKLLGYDDEKPAEPKLYSQMLPTPAQVDADTTRVAQVTAQALTQPNYAAMSRNLAAHPPGVPTPPLPLGLQNEDQNQPVPTSEMAIPQSNFVTEGLDAITGGVAHMAQPGMRSKAGGASRAIRGAMEIASPTIPAAIAAAPVAAGTSLALGAGAQQGAEALLKKIGIPEEYAAFAGDLLGLFAGVKTHGAIERLRAKYEPVLRQRYERAQSKSGQKPARAADVRPEVAQTSPLDLGRILYPEEHTNETTSQSTAAAEEKPASAEQNAGQPDAGAQPGKPENAVRGPLLEKETGPHGPIFRDLSGRPADAIAKLAREKNGEVPAVWQHPELGPIDLIWGNENGGLRHIIEKHVEGRKDLKLDDLAEEVPRMRVVKNDGRTARLESTTHEGGIRLDYDGKEKRWLVTAYEKPSTGGSPLVSGSPQASPQSDGHTPSDGSNAPAAGGTLDGSGNHPAGGPTSPPTGVNSSVGGGAAPLQDETPPTGKTTDTPGTPEARRDDKTPPPSGAAPTPERSTYVPGNPKAEETAPSSPGSDFSVESPAETGQESRGSFGPVTMGSGLGALQPYYERAVQSFSESAAEMKALKAKRDAALEALRASEATPEEKQHGKIVRRYFTGERDFWGVRVNQAIERLKKLVPDPTEQEALSLMRDFRNRPGELQAFLSGTHPDLTRMSLDNYDAAMKRIEKLKPVMEKALHPTPRMLAADRALTHIARATRLEGKARGVLDNSISDDEYVPHLLRQKGSEENGWRLLEMGGKATGGKIGRQFRFAETREIPTLAHAVAYGLKPPTLNAFDAFTVHGDEFARARATHMLIGHLKDEGVGKWGAKAGEAGVPEGWTEIAPHAQLFQQMRAFADPETGEPAIARQTLFVPRFIEEALRPITDPDYTGRIAGFRKLRMWQSLIKSAELGWSLFHLRSENFMALANMGPRGWMKAQMIDRASQPFLEAERDMVLHGGTSPIQGKTVEVYKGINPNSIPTWADVAAHAPLIKQLNAGAVKLSEFIFDNQMRKFKVTNYALRKAAWMAKNPNATPAEMSAALHSITAELNAVYGGLHTENLGINKATVEVARAIMLAPDWTFSNFFNVKTVFEGGWRGTEGAKMARMFWLRAVVGGLAATQGMSLLMSGHLSRRPTMVYLGKDNQGREIYQNLAFAGAPADVTNLITNVHDYGAVIGLSKSVAGKLGPVPRTAVDMITNEDFLGHKIVSPGMNPAVQTLRGAYEAGKDVAPLPFSATNLVEMLQGTDEQKYQAREIITTLLFGQPPRHVAPEGTRMTRHGLRRVRPHAQHSFWQQLMTGRP